MLRVDAEFLDHVRTVFGLPEGEPAALTVAGRGAVGRTWRLDLGPRRYALKELFRAVDHAAVDVETAFTARLSQAGVLLPDSLPAADGRFAVPVSEEFGDGWLRLYRWVDGAPVDPAAAGDVAARLGELLGRLHANALPPGTRPDPWYETTPDPRVWSELVDQARAQGRAWAQPLAERLPVLTELAELVTPLPPELAVTCHCDLHPGNVLVDDQGQLVLLDWDDVGPAGRDRELAMVLLRWHLHDGELDTAALRTTLDAYQQAGGTGWLRDRSSFGMAVACDLNFLRRQAVAALRPDTVPEHREYAELEIWESLTMLCGVQVLDDLLQLVRRCG